MMLWTSAGELVARGQPPLTATELMALAIESGIAKSTDGDKPKMLNDWGKLARAHAPLDLQARAAVVLERQKLEREAARLREENERHKSLMKELEREAASFQSVADYLDGRRSKQPGPAHSANSIAGEGFRTMIDRIVERFK